MASGLAAGLLFACSKLDAPSPSGEQSSSSGGSAKADLAARTSGTRTTASGAKTMPSKTKPGAKTIPRAEATARGTETCAGECLSIERCGAGKCVPNCPEGEVYVPATSERGFEMGRGEPEEADRRHTVVLTKPFCMDETEVSVGAYRACVTGGHCEEPQLRDIHSNYREVYQRDDHPLNMVDRRRALMFCEHYGKTLPTEAQFEWAAGHGDGRKYPWGDEDPTCNNGLADFTPRGAPKSDPAGDVGCHGGGTSPVKSHPKGATEWPDGKIYDLGGNVWEWSLDCARNYPRDKQVDPSPTSHPHLGDGCWVYGLRGGGWNRSMYALRVHTRGAARKNYTVPGLGFRCVRNPR